MKWLNDMARRVSRAVAIRRSRSMIRLGDAARDARNYRVAADQYLAALLHAPENLSIRVQCAHMHKELGAFEEAEVHYLFAAERRPDDADLQLQLGHFYKTVGKIDAAIAAYTRAESLAPGWPEPLIEINNLHRRKEPLFHSLGEFLQTAASRPALQRLLSTPRAPVILVLTEDDENLVELRVRVPFEAMRLNGIIGGYVVLNHGKVVLVGGSTAELGRIDLVWAQRAPLNCLNFLVECCAGDYVYDIDDNLLITPGYRPPWAPEWISSITLLMEQARLITTPSARLCASLEAHLPFSVTQRTVIAPNLTEAVSPRAFSGPPAGLLIAASDALPMTTSKASFLRAVDRFCRTREVPLVYMGSGANDFCGLACEVINLGMMSYDRYRSELRRQNLMAVAPLEMWGDERTTEFVNGKSDIKMVEFGAAGIPGVYANASPYLDSPLRVGPLIDCGDEAELVQALWEVAEDADRFSRLANERVAELRLAKKVVAASWGQAVDAGRMAHPMDLATIVDLLNASRPAGIIRSTIPSRAAN